MDLLILVLFVALIGWLVYIITTKVDMPKGWAPTIQVLALVIMVLWLLSHFVLLPNVLPRR
jgi:hypothetical protein